MRREAGIITEGTPNQEQHHHGCRVERPMKVMVALLCSVLWLTIIILSHFLRFWMILWWNKDNFWFSHCCLLSCQKTSQPPPAEIITACCSSTSSQGLIHGQCCIHTRDLLSPLCPDSFMSTFCHPGWPQLDPGTTLHTGWTGQPGTRPEGCERG